MSGSGRSRRVNIREHGSLKTPFGGAEHLVDGCQIMTEEAAYGESNHANVPIEDSASHRTRPAWWFSADPPDEGGSGLAFTPRLRRCRTVTGGLASRGTGQQRAVREG